MPVLVNGQETPVVISSPTTPVILTGGSPTPIIVSGGTAVPLIVVNPARGAVLSAPYIPIIKVEQGDDPPAGYVGLVVREQ